MALAGLVADYTDSSDNEDLEEKDTVAQVKDSTTSLPKSADFFTTTANESDSDEESESQETNNTLPSDAQNKSLLPNPLANPFAPSAALSQSPLSSEVKGSVFGNRFAKQEKAQIALYEKHVKMTEDKMSSKPPCFKFKKGFCIKGDKCRFSHDLGFQAPNKYQEVEEPVVAAAEPGVSGYESTHPVSSNKRPGVTNTMMPSKKAKKALDAQRANTARYDLAR